MSLLTAGWVLGRGFARPRTDVWRAFNTPVRLDDVQLPVRSARESALAQLLATEIVQRLFGQRQKLLETQMSVTAEAVELEKRLGRIKRQMQSRFHAYERRIAGLEKELAEAEELSRELIQAKIRTAKRELREAQEQEITTERNRLNLN